MAKDNELVIKVNGNIKGYQDALKAASAETESLQGRFNSIAKTGAIAFAGLGTSIVLAARSAGKFETIQAQFETLTGSVSEAQQIIQELSDFTAKTPFRFEEVAQAGKQLLAFKIQADQLKPTLKDIGDVAAATGANFKDLTLIFGQVKAAGKLTGERLLQLEERAVPIGPALAKTMGVAETAIRDLVSKGEVDFATFQKAFASLSKEGGLAFEGMAKRSQTLEGQLSTLADNFDLLTADVGKKFLPVFKQLTGAFTNLLGFLRENPAMSEFISRALVAGTVVGGLATAVGVAGTIFLKLRASMIAATIATRGMSFAVKGLVGATGIGLIVAFLPEIIEGFKWAFDGALAIITGFKDKIVKIFSALGKIIASWWKIDLAGLKAGLAEFKKAFSEATTTTIKEFKKRRQAEEDQKKATEQNQKDAEKSAKSHQDKLSEIQAGALDKRSQKLKDESEIIKAELAGREKKEIDFLKRRQEIRQKERDAQVIQNEERRKLALENIKLLNEKLLKDEKEFFAKRDAQRAEQREAEEQLRLELESLSASQRDALQKAELDSLKKTAESKEKIRSKAAKQELLNIRKENELRAADEEKFGKIIATTKAFFRKEDVINAQTAANQLAQLQHSQNATLKTIGKAAALVQIGINTQKGAIAAYSALAGIPLVGPGLGAAAAAAIIAFGAERAARVQAAQAGGIVAGTGFGDRVPFLLEPGELITPRQNFEEVINAVADQRITQREAEEGFEEETEERAIRLDIGFDGDEAADVLTVKQNEQRFLGTSQVI